MSSSNFIQQTLLFAQEVGQDVNELRKRVGSLNQLKTADKQSIVNAVNEIKEALDEIGDATVAIPDWSLNLDRSTTF